MKNFLLFCCLFSFYSVIGQSPQTYSGRVTDEDTEEGVPFANVFLPGTTTGVSTDVDGYFEIEIPNNSDSLTASALGYLPLTKTLIGITNNEINFLMPSSDLKLAEVVVLSGENPANKIVKQIQKSRKKNRPESLDNYQCEAYYKTEMDLVNFNPKWKDSKAFKSLGFVFEQIDSLSDEKPFLPAYIWENVSEVSYVKGKQKKKVPIAQRASGVQNQTVIDFMSEMHREFSVYDNWIAVLEKNLVSPFSDLGLLYYEYYLIDSTDISGHKSYKMKFKPKRKQESTFVGIFWVDANSHAIQRVNMRMSEDVNINLIDRVVVYEEFELQGDSFWLPVKQKMLIDFKATEKLPGIIGKKTTTFKDYKLSQPDFKEEYSKKDPDDFTLESLEKSDSFWLESRHEELSQQELGIYEMVDSIGNLKIFKTYIDLIRTLAVGYQELGPVEIGPYSTLYSFNAVEGHRFQLGVRTSKQFSKKYRVGVYGAYGLRDERWKYGADFIYNIKRKPRFFVGASFFDDTQFSVNNSEDLSGGGNVLSGVTRRNVPAKLVRVREAKAYIDRDWKKGWSSRMTVLNRYIDPYGGGPYGFDFKFIPEGGTVDQVDTTAQSTEIIFKARWAKDEKFVEGAFDRTSFGSFSPILTLQYHLGINKAYPYHKVGLSFRHWVYTSPFGWFGYRVRLGKVFGRVPSLLLDVQPGNETFFYSKTAFNGINLFEFVSDTYAEAKVEYHFEGYFLNKIPLIRKLKFREVVTFKTFWGTLSEENFEANRLNTSDLAGLIPIRSATDEPYMEVGVGLENILKVLRVDAVWRLNYLDNLEAQRFSIRGSFDFYF